MEKHATADHSPHPGPVRSPRLMPGPGGCQPSPQLPTSSQHAMNTGPAGQHHAGINKPLVSTSQQAMSTLAASHQTMTNLLSSRLGK